MQQLPIWPANCEAGICISRSHHLTQVPTLLWEEVALIASTEGKCLEPGTSISLVLSPTTELESSLLLEQMKGPLRILDTVGWGTGGFHFPFNSHCRIGARFQHALPFLLCCLSINMLSIFKFRSPCLPSNAPIPWENSIQ